VKRLIELPHFQTEDESQMAPQIDRDELFDLLKRMIRINSVGVGLAGCEEAERPMVAFLDEYLRGLGLSLDLQEVRDGRKNVIARMAGSGKKTLILEGHMDIVSIAGMEIPPFDPVEREGRIYGRGSCDTKAGIACLLAALSAFARVGERPPANLIFIGMVGEETNFEGAEVLVERKSVQADGALVAEPTMCQTVTAHKGGSRYRLRTLGRAAHGALPQLGVNAISKMMRVIQLLEEQLMPQLAERDHALCGPPTMNIGLITGGIQPNFVPDQCEITIDRRLIPGERGVETISEVRRLVEKLAQDDPEFRFEIEPYLTFEPMEAPLESEIVQCAMAATGQTQPEGVAYGTDASYLQRLGFPCVVLGPGSIAQAHGAVEYVAVEQV
jgi:acetylornithine deacetylase/succinyl-diaminopimelate desuccinylase family protein